MAIILPHKASFVEVVTLHWRAQMALFRFATYFWNKIWDENLRVYRQWYIRVSVNPGVNPCKPPLVFGQESFESIMHTCYHLFTTYPDIFQRISSTLGLVCRLNVGFKCSPVNPTADAFTLHCLKMCCKHWYSAWEHACFMRIDAFTLRCGMNRQYPRDAAFKSAR